jgi:hypothetical protein
MIPSIWDWQKKAKILQASSILNPAVEGANLNERAYF